jgi:hypothetical protein
LPAGLPIVLGAPLSARPRPALRFGPKGLADFFPLSAGLPKRTPRPDHCAFASLADQGLTRQRANNKGMVGNRSICECITWCISAN